MKWILLYWIAINGQALSTHTQEFDSQVACEAAGHKIDGVIASSNLSDWGGVFYGKYYCVEK
jgi:hypothetical protein